jgi:DGQHR domain-containing protein
MTMTAELKDLTGRGTGTLALEGRLIVQAGQPMLVTAASAKDVTRQSKVDVYDPQTDAGYQRERQGYRAQAAARYYKAGGRMPNPLLLNIREEDFERVKLVVLNDEAGYHTAVEDGGNWIGTARLEVPVDMVLWLYDGQHREGSFEILLGEDESFSDFPIPLSITLGLDSLEEMKEFYEVNTNAKSVKTDLAWVLLKKRAEADPDLADLIETSGRDWVTRGLDVIAELRKLSGVWKDSIQAPNQGKARSDRLTVTQAQVVRSLKPVLDMPVLAKADPKTVAEIIRAYWEGIAKVLPQPFDPANNPKNWVIQKGPGVIALHRVLPQVIEVLRARGTRLGDPDAYAQVMADLPKLSGEVVNEDGEAQIVSGEQFWRSGPEGVASQFTGDAGRKRLGIRIQSLLPKPAEEIAL